MATGRQVNKQAHTPSGDDGADPQPGAQSQINAQGADDLLDEIDDLLEDNAEEFVRSYVQKGGQ
ncbi:ubiquitin-like protein Pup [Corynebacterium mendelii]|uniref:Prokaryotic ubiquitin-like protein Pup n=1 Tax=Corynebacterium mendelii TaxID=2765362 RepID=A0A939IWY3_9CORY|nr:ubiquitin-like protein Pup [Corynebacterium mendelii]MBN9643508.1 ubiquitin-like protein Pup [Corynebacterium mendelii]